MNHGGCVWDTDHPSEWLDFSANLRPEGPAEWIPEAIHQSLENIRYYPDPEMKRARRGMARFLGIPEKCILPTSGGAAAIDLVTQLDDGCVFTLPPTFGEYTARAAVHGRKTAVWEGMCGPGDTLMICNPNNPTGEIRTQEELAALLAEVKAGGGSLIVDEAFIEYCPEYSLRRNLCSGLIILGSFSKILGIPGIRLGYICAEPETIDRLRQKTLPWTPDAAATEIAAALPEHREEIAAECELNRKRRNLFGKQLLTYDLSQLIREYKAAVVVYVLSNNIDSGWRSKHADFSCGVASFFSSLIDFNKIFLQKFWCYIKFFFHFSRLPFLPYS